MIKCKEWLNSNWKEVLKTVQKLREQKKVLSKLEEELEKISSQDKENRQLRDKLIGELKSRMQKGEL